MQEIKNSKDSGMPINTIGIMENHRREPERLYKSYNK
jgi:hypothetical protein